MMISLKTPTEPRGKNHVARRKNGRASVGEHVSPLIVTFLLHGVVIVFFSHQKKENGPVVAQAHTHTHIHLLPTGPSPRYGEDLLFLTFAPLPPRVPKARSNV